MAAPIREFDADSLRVRVFTSLQDLAENAAGAAHAILSETIAARGEARVVVATGNSQLAFLDALARKGVDASRIVFFHLDEYLGLNDRHPASFRRYLRERVEERLKPKAFHYLAGDCLEPIAECARYSALLAEAPIDLCCLGIGENGHLAFNDPPVANFDDTLAVKLVKLDDACRQQQVGEGHFPNTDAVPQYALTMTVPAICAAKAMLCIVPEKRKARAVRETLKGPVSSACPGSILRHQKNCTLFLDADSASEV
jgi:glucosamine-6-phosphate deaminase